MGTKFKSLLGTDFSESESSKFSGMVTTVLEFSGTAKLAEFLGLNLVQMFKKFRIGILNFGTNGLY